TVKKKLLEDLKATRRRGYAIDRQEAVQGMGCMGAPIFDHQGRVAGALSLSGPVNQVLGDQKDELAGEVLSTAAEISRLFGYFPAIMETGAS
ncbi:MAG: IclR family transcriptional regulator domain-containing protein, partial [Desulfosalsimonas sp.]